MVIFEQWYVRGQCLCIKILDIRVMGYMNRDILTVTDIWSAHEGLILTGDGTLSRKANGASSAAVGVRSAADWVEGSVEAPTAWVDDAVSPEGLVPAAWEEGKHNRWWNLCQEVKGRVRIYRHRLHRHFQISRGRRPSITHVSMNTCYITVPVNVAWTSVLLALLTNWLCMENLRDLTLLASLWTETTLVPANRNSARQQDKCQI